MSHVETDLNEKGLRSHMAEESSEDIIRAWQQDPDEIFRHLFLRYYARVFYFFQGRRFSPPESADLAQETFLRVFRGLPQLRAETSFDFWLFQIVANVWKSELRAKSTMKRNVPQISLDEAPHDAEAETIPSSDPDPLSESLHTERRRILYKAVEDLPPQLRRCVMLRVRYDLKYREIADLMNISIETVKSQLFEARQRLKATLGDYFDDEEL